jgi:hypothetical protein
MSEGKEREILRYMRKLLAAIVRDTTPRPGQAPVLSQNTVQGIRECFGLIAAREQELAKELGMELHERPVYPDQETKAKIVPMPRPGKGRDSKV